jgi:hypothetical protein
MNSKRTFPPFFKHVTEKKWDGSGAKDVAKLLECSFSCINLKIVLSVTQLSVFSSWQMWIC